MRRLRRADARAPGNLLARLAPLALWAAALAPAGATAQEGPAGEVQLAASIPATALLEQHPPELVVRLHEEKVVLLPAAEGSDFVEALVIFEQPRPRVLRLLTQTGRQREFRPELKRLETVAFYDDGVLDEQGLRIMFQSINYRLRYRMRHEDHRIDWSLDPRFDNDVERVDGYWVLHAMGEERTLARFGTAVNVGPALPAFLQDMATRKTVPQTLERTRRWVDSDGRWRP